MLLKTRLPHLRGQSVQVGSQQIDINPNGIADVSDEDAAQQLLASAGQVWTLHDPNDTGTPPKARARVRGKPIFTKAADRADGDLEGDVDSDTLDNDPLLSHYAGVPQAADAPEPDAEEVRDPSTGANTKRQPRHVRKKN